MRNGRRVLVLGLLVSVLLGFPQTAWAEVLPPPPVAPTLPAPLPETSPAVAGQVVEMQAASAPAGELALASLSAVLVVGPIDGDRGAWTLQEIANMETAAQALEAHGVTVRRFYTPNNDWAQITAAARSAQFFLYRGHGVGGWSYNSQPLVGGLALRGAGEMDLVLYSPDQLRRELHLAPNAIVMLYACYSAGSAGSEPDLPSPTAQTRVAQYSDPFVDNGAAGYYADWRPESFPALIHALFSGLTLGQAYESFYDYSPQLVERYNSPEHVALALWLSKFVDAAGTKYHYAFTGKAGFTLSGLFGVRQMDQDLPHKVFMPVMFTH